MGASNSSIAIGLSCARYLGMDGLHLSFYWTARFISYEFGKCGRPFAAGWAHPVITPPAEKAVSKLSTSDF